jgi:hypothetical protein
MEKNQMDEKDLQERMDALTDTEIQRDIVVAERETLKQKQIPIQVQVELEQIDEEFAPKIEQIELNIKSRKEQLQSLLKEYSKEHAGKEGYILKSKGYSWKWEDEVVWDAKALDGYSLNHPEILWMRGTKPTSRLTPKKSKI